MEGRREGGEVVVVSLGCSASLIPRLTLALLVGPSALFSSMCHRIGPNTLRRTAIGGRSMHACLNSSSGFVGVIHLKKIPHAEKRKLKRVAPGTSSDFFVVVVIPQTHLHSIRESVSIH